MFFFVPRCHLFSVFVWILSLWEYSINSLMHSVFNSCDVLKPYVAHIDDIFKDFTSYKVRVPVTGAIILDETYERVSLLGIFIGKVPIYPLYI